MSRLISFLLMAVLQVSLAVAATYNLKVVVTPEGAGSLNTSGGTYEEGSSVYLYSYPNTGFKFQGWYDQDDALLSSSSSFYYNMPATDAEVRAQYVYDPNVPADPEQKGVAYTVNVVCRPAGSGSFNVSSTSGEEGSTVRLYAYTNTGFRFLHWEDAEGNTLSTAQNFDYTIPGGNSTVYGCFEYDPATPDNPAKNYWNPLTGEVIVDDFTTGRLTDAVASVISGSSYDDVTMITVAGRMNNNDFGVANSFSNCMLLDLSRVTGITEVPSYAFDYTNLESVYLPATIEKIGYRAFDGCSKLAALTCYAMTPPALESYVFRNIPEGLVVYVPAASLPLYQEAEVWRDFTLLPIQADVRSLTVNIPSDVAVADFAGMWLEITNANNGQRMHYVVTDRTAYTFNNLIKNTTWSVAMRSQAGSEFGRIDGIEIKDEDVAVSFTSLSKPQNVELLVMSPKGIDVTDKTQITWTDAAGNYLAQGRRVSGLPTGSEVGYTIGLDKDLSMECLAPEAARHTVADAGNVIELDLAAIPTAVISGKVKDAQTGMALQNATVSASQTFAGRYSSTVTARTDASGYYSVGVAQVPTTLSVAATDYVSQSIVCDTLMTGNAEIALADVALRSISGTVINLAFTYTECGSQEPQGWYADYNNISYTIFNATKQQAVADFSVQYPKIVMMTSADPGDVLTLTATSKASAFMPVEASATVDDNNVASATFGIVQLGKIQASFASNANAAVTGTLYDGAGKLVKTYSYSNAALTISDLADGHYTLVTMGESRFFNSIYSLDQIPQSGLEEGTDYVASQVDVVSGQIAVVSIDAVPTLDESQFYYTGENTSFTVNKPEITSGNYLTFTGRIDFRGDYAQQMSNLQLVVDLPESCEFVENSVMVGNASGSYTLDGNRIAIPMARYTDRVRFCVIPTRGGDFAPSAFAQFDLDNQSILQPIGSAHYTVKDLSISVPATVAKTAIPISGTAPARSTVDIYDNDVLIGQTTSLANGTWATTCELNEPYNLSRHSIYARVTTAQDLDLQSETKEFTLNQNYVQANTVEMTFYNGWLRKNVSVTFDFQSGTVSESSYMFYTGTNITFIADLTNNSPDVVSDVDIIVYTDRNEVRQLSATYDAARDRWVAVSRFESNNLPINLAIRINADYSCYSDRLLFDVYAERCDVWKESMEATVDSVDAINAEILALEALMAEKTEQFQTLQQQIEQNQDDENAVDQLLVQYLKLAGLESSVSDFDIEVPDEIDDDYIQASIEAVETLLNYQDEPFDDSAFEEFLKRIDSDIESASYTEDFDGYDYELTDTVSVETEYGPMIAYRAALASFDMSTIVDCDTITVPTTDGKAIVAYVNTADNTAIIVDEVGQFVWYIHSAEVAEQMKAVCDLLRANGEGFVDAVKQSILKIENFMESGLATVSKWIDDANRQLDFYQSLKNEISNQRAVLLGQRAGKQMRIIELEKQLKNLRATGNWWGAYDTDNTIAKLKSERIKLLEQIENTDKNIDNLNKRLSSASAKSLRMLGFLATAKDVYDLFKGLYTIISHGNAAIQDYNKWKAFIDSILPCKDDQAKAQALKTRSESDWSDIAWRKGYIPSLAITGLATGVNGYMMTNKVAGWMLRAIVSFFTSFMNNTADEMFKQAREASRAWYPKRVKEYNKLKCEKKIPLDDDDGDDNDEEPPFPPISPIHDPSGYVYEGVSSNRLEGVMASCYYKETLEDMYGDPYEQVVLWDAEEYAQKNPLFTDENGMYRWDVPQGLWQVKFEKDGYETTTSEWLPVPPPQLEVNIAMKQNRQPLVAAAKAYADGVEITFDKYMDPSYLTAEQIIVSEAGEPVAGEVSLLDEEISYEGAAESYASRVRFVPAAPFTADEVTLMVTTRVRSYAGVPMQDTYQQTLDIEPELKAIVASEAITVNYGGSTTFAVTALPAAAAEGKTLTVVSSSEMIVAVDASPLTLDANGSAMVTIYGELPGTASVSFAIEGTEVKASSIVSVVMPAEGGAEVAAPVASIASGSEVAQGTELYLSCDTEGARIYYTLDESCPCDPDGSRILYDGTPIVINETVVINAMAELNGAESEVVTLFYSVDGSGLIDLLRDDISVTPLLVRDFVKVSVGSHLCDIDVVDARGLHHLALSKVTGVVDLDFTSLTAGVYLVTISSSDGCVVKKVIRM